PRVVGELDGEEVTAQNGRFGPYMKKGTDSRSLETEEQIFTITLKEAEELFSKPKQRSRRAATPPLRELGEDPATGVKMVIKDGRFGPYVTDGQTNASLRKGDEVESLSDLRAAELLAERRAKAPAKKKTAAKKTTKTTTAKTAAKKSATKKTGEPKTGPKGSEGAGHPRAPIGSPRARTRTTNAVVDPPAPAHTDVTHGRDVFHPVGA